VGVPGVAEVRGYGLMLGLGLSVPAAPIRNELLERYHIFTGSASDKYTIRLLPALNLDPHHADRFTKALTEVLATA
jgi:acetylornithine aminotransferase